MSRTLRRERKLWRHRLLFRRAARSRGPGKETSGRHRERVPVLKFLERSRPLERCRRPAHSAQNGLEIRLAFGSVGLVWVIPDVSQGEARLVEQGRILAYRVELHMAVSLSFPFSRQEDLI